MPKLMFYYLFSDLMVKCCQYKKNFYQTLSAVAVAGFQTKNLISKTCCKQRKIAIFFSWGMLLRYILNLKNLDGNC